MKYLNMRPRQIREAIAAGVPAVLPLGVVEYHAEHLPVGCDCFVCINALERVEARHPELVLLPPFYYGCASHAVAASANNGTVHVEAQHLAPVAEDIFRELLTVGFRNIHAFVAHQTEKFEQGMPTDLAFKFGAKNAVFAFLEKTAGQGWWGDEKFSSYYSGGNDPFSWISIHPVEYLPVPGEEFESDHAGKLETSQMLAIHPELTAMEELDSKLWFSRPAAEATAEYGEVCMESAAAYVEKILYPEQ